MDPILPLSPDGDATAQASPAVAMMRAAADAKKRALDQTALQNQYKQSEEQRMQAQEGRMHTQGDLAAAREQHLQTQDQNAGLQRTMAGDMAITSQNPAYKGTKWDALDSVDPNLRGSYADRYGVDAMGNAQALWDKNTPQYNRVLRGQASKAGIQFAPDASDDEVQSLIAQDAQQKEAAKQKAGESTQSAATQRLLTQVLRTAQNNKQVSGYQSARTNYDSVQRNAANPNRTGADDTFLLQAAATMENPTRSTTGNDIKEFMQAKGITGNLSTLADRYNALINQSPEAQTRAGRILDDRTVQQIAASAQRSLQARRESLTEIMTPFVNRMEDLGQDPYRHFPKELVDDVYGIAGQQQPQGQVQQPQGQPSQPRGQPSVPVDTRNPIQQVLQAPKGQTAPVTATAQPQTVRMQSPEGDFYTIPVQNVEAAKQRGFK